MAGPSLRARLRRVRLFLCDVDGILTDASVFMGPGLELKRFNIRDGLGLRWLQDAGIKVGWISRRPSPATTARAEDLKIDFLVQTRGDKVEAAQEILHQTGLKWEQAAYLGDDVVDLGMLRRAGLAVSVPDGCREARQCAHYVTRQAGGQGAVREVVEMILKAQGCWTSIVKSHSR
jgi:3-deoxy-D-manno-octulosonate 8-phosphate phosphatase (KDO 8-P phosphatase)